MQARLYVSERKYSDLMKQKIGNSSIWKTEGCFSRIEHYRVRFHYSKPAQCLYFRDGGQKIVI